MARVGELGADLVGAAGDELALHQGQAVPAVQGAVAGQAGLGPGLGPVGDVDPVFCRILEQEALQFAGGGLHSALDDRQVVLLQLPVPDLLVQDPQGLGGLRRDDDAAGVAVDAVAQGGGEGVLRPGVPFALCVEIGLDVVDEGLAVLRTVVGVDRQTGALVRQEDVGVLIYNIQFRRADLQIRVLRLRGVEKFVGDVELDRIALAEPVVPLGPLAVALDALEADVLLQQRLRQQRHRLAHKAVQALIRVVFPDLQFSHASHPSLGGDLFILSGERAEMSTIFVLTSRGASLIILRRLHGKSAIFHALMRLSYVA